jgi:predicted RNA-binding protein Jag
MNQESRATLEIIAPSVEEAINQGLKELGLARDQVEIEILDEGSKGLFGLGNRQARVRLTLKNQGQDIKPNNVAPKRKRKRRRILTRILRMRKTMFLMMALIIRQTWKM